MKNFTLFFKQYLEEDTFSVTVSCLFWILTGFQSEIENLRQWKQQSTRERKDESLHIGGENYEESTQTHSLTSLTQ